jgi:hypothetical protein
MWFAKKPLQSEVLDKSIRPDKSDPENFSAFFSADEPYPGATPHVTNIVASGVTDFAR